MVGDIWRVDREEGPLTRRIVTIDVERLFGRYDYNLRLTDEGEEAPRVSLLYGDNGTGKTTILELVFHLLSPARGRGHKTSMLEMPFLRFSIVFSDNTEITAYRSGDRFVGDFFMKVTLQDGQSESAEFSADSQTGAIRKVTPQMEKVLNMIGQLALDVLYLRDSRDLESDAIPSRDRNRDRSIILRPRNLPLFEEGDWFDPDADDKKSPLVELIERTKSWLSEEAIHASFTGETEARESHTNILRTITSASVLIEAELQAKVLSIKEEIKELETLSRNFAEFELGSVIDSRSMLESLENAEMMALPVVVHVLDSFLDGLRTRLNAINGLYEKMRRFVTTINRYLTDKEITLRMRNGLSIELPAGRLEPDSLSSGEKHLLLLFLNVLISVDHFPLFIIDEPELSLNVKWQRRLVDSLLELSEDSQCQFLLATHSIELLAKHRNRVVGLAP